MKWALMGTLGIIIIFSISGCTSNGVGQISGGQSSQTPNCRTVQESYTEQVPYQEQDCDTVPYTDTICEFQNLVYSKSETECQAEK